ncbi:MAG: hypothetical protein ACFCUE_02760 [Candidatus Bathyarchaeia archaeon]|jgi:hypothetical protein
MSEYSFCELRKIARINQETPLLIPSFSSILDEKIGLVHSRLRNRLPLASLVSAYDLSNNLINRDEIWASDVVVVDSGNYEYSNLFNSTLRKNWCLENYFTFLKTLKPMSKVIIVNFDEKTEIKTQISHANSLFDNFNNYAHCFLYRPISGYFDFDEYTSKIDELAQFDVLGITEKELGRSIIERCINLMKLRKALKRKDLELPIHVFGCIDPLGVLLFYLSGADMFDGTNWLKLSFDNNLAIYPNNSAVISGAWNSFDSSVFEYICAENLRKLTNLMFQLKKYTNEHDLCLFKLDSTTLENVKNIITTAQSNVER